MKNILTVLKKELLRVFKDKNLIIALIVPGILIFVLYSIMGSSMTGIVSEDADATYRIVSVGMPNDVKDVFATEEVGLKAEYSTFEIDDLEEQTTRLQDGEIDLVVMFTAGFEEDIENMELAGIAVYYNPGETRSAYCYQKVMTGLELYRQAILADRNLVVEGNVFALGSVSVADESALVAGIFANMIPFLIITFLFSGCMAVAPDAIAGEKERGTIATILITPIKRSQLALGKVLALGILASISALSSFLGLMFSLPKLLGDAADAISYGFTQYILILLVLLSTVLLIIGIMSVLSSLAKTVKEASMFIMPFMFVSMLVGLASFIGDGAMKNALIYLVPLLNSTQSLSAILNFAEVPLNLALCVVSNFVYVGIFIFFLTKLFNNEKVMFKK